MTPREFIEQYGQPSARTVLIPPGQSIQIQPDMDRCVLAFMSSLNGGFYLPAGEDFGVATPSSPPFGGDAVIFTHTLHASLVNIGWTLSAIGVPVQAIIVEVFMRPKRTVAPRKAKPYVRKTANRRIRD